MNRKKSRIAIIAIAALLIAALCFLIWPTGPAEIDSGYHVVMGTFARIVAIAPNSRTAKKSIEAALDQIRSIDELMSDFKPDSEISRVNNNAFTRAVKVSEATFEVLQKSIEFSKLSAGAFDITIGPVVNLWREAAEANSVPTDPELSDARSKVGFDKLILDANEMTVRFTVDGMRLDLGGIAKGYAIDKAVETMQSCGATGAMVDIGGDIRCFGTPPKPRLHWLIGLQDPNVTTHDLDIGTTLLTLKLSDAAIATSGVYRRFVLIDGKKYSHIFDTKTGRSSDRLTSVTIISTDAITADALATTVSVMGPEKGLALIENLPDTEAILISPPPKYELTKTPAAEKYIK